MQMEQMVSKGNEGSNNVVKEPSNDIDDHDHHQHRKEKEEEEKKEKELERICLILSLTERQLDSIKEKSSEETSTITKTCRAIVKELYPDKKKLRKVTVRKLKEKTDAIRGKAEMTL